ncbi:MAG: DUF2207 domain-containing protein [Firmicutes bacterium]|nr:DUF2207 domain-containing protein [Bacillota bacterium]
MYKLSFKKKKRVSLLPSVLVLAAVIFAGFMAGFWNPDKVQAYGYSFDTTSFRTDVTVNSDNSFDITETITVDFHEQKHGIFRYIPLEGTALYRVGDETVNQSRKMKIDRIKVEGYEFDTYMEEGNRVIKIGDADKTLSGKHTYRLSYRCRAYDDKIDAYDLFYYNVIPSGAQGGWETPIDKVLVRITMPEAVDRDNLSVFAGYYGTNSYQDRIKTRVSGNIIELESKEQLPQGAGVTVQQILPEGYFQNEMSTDWAYPLLILIGLLTAAASVLLWVCLGRDPRLVQTVEFYPPEQLTSADMGYIVDGYADKKDIVSMIIYFADQGYLRIEEEERGSFVLCKTKELPDGRNDFEYTLMNGFFPGGETRTELSQLRKEFFEDYQTAVRQLKEKYKQPKNRIFYKSGSRARIAAAFLMIVPVGAGILLSSVLVQDMSWAIAAVPVSIVLFILYLIGMMLYDQKSSMKKSSFFASNVVVFLLSALVLLGAGGLISWLAGAAGGVAAVLCSVVSYICARQMRRRTPYGNQLTGRVLGFRHFIETCELERLEMLAAENPSYFYNILPYAYIFGLSDKWAKKFESIAVEPPKWYGGHYGHSAFNTWVFMNAFHPCTYAMQQNLNIPSASSDSGGGGFSGGSFSGGGFSGGGFGGGGGGSW